MLFAQGQDADIRKQSPIIKWLSADKREFGFGSGASVRAVFADSPVYPPLQTSCCAAVNHRFGPQAAIRPAEALIGRVNSPPCRLLENVLCLVDPSLVAGFDVQ